MIIQTGMRTDIPAFYTPWLLNRLRAGFVMARNPFDPSSVTRYSLDPAVVDLIGFCTKNPAPMLPHLDALAPWGQYWFVTVTPYGRDIEPHAPDVDKALDDLCRLSDALGPHRVAWRYDPILILGRYTLEFHMAAFERMAARLAGRVRTCVISFIDLYEKVKHNFPEVRPVARADRLAIGEHFAAVGRKYGMTIKTCGEGDELARFGVDCSGCMTAEVYEQALGCRLNIPAGKPARQACACYLSGDIGAYDSCGHLCRYCYANSDPDRVRRSMAAHDPESPFLIGHETPGDRVHSPRQVSWKNLQTELIL